MVCVWQMVCLMSVCRNDISNVAYHRHALLVPSEILIYHVMSGFGNFGDVVSHGLSSLCTVLHISVRMSFPIFAFLSHRSQSETCQDDTCSSGPWSLVCHSFEAFSNGPTTYPFVRQSVYPSCSNFFLSFGNLQFLPSDCLYGRYVLSFWGVCECYHWQWWQHYDGFVHRLVYGMSASTPHVVLVPFRDGINKLSDISHLQVTHWVNQLGPDLFVSLCHIPYICASHPKFRMSDPIRSDPQIHTRSITISFFIHILFI